MQFNEMGLDPRILKGIEAMGFETPSPIQEQFIPVFLKEPKDIVGLAQTGTGKTAAFGLPILQIQLRNLPASRVTAEYLHRIAAECPGPFEGLVNMPRYRYMYAYTHKW